jgi:hypothetical protein
MRRKRWIVPVLGIALLPVGALAQGGPSGPVGYQLPLGVAHMSGAGLDGGGAVSATRWFVEPGARFTGAEWGAIGVALGYGETDYDFADGAAMGGAAPWGTIRDLRLSLPVSIEAGERTEVFLIPSLRLNAESGADLTDGETWGALGGVAWRFGDRLRLGPGLGWFSELEGSGSVFPVLIVDWQIDERWSLTTGEGFGATQGPGLTLNWRAADAWSLGLTARYESVQFRLDDDGPAPGGVGEDESIPVVLGARWQPNPGIRVSLFAGVQTGGTLMLYDSDGDRVARQEYDTAPLAGLTARLRF